MASIRDLGLVPVYDRFTPGQRVVLPEDFATNTGAVDDRVMSMVAQQQPSGLTSRSVRTVEIDPMTGNPVQALSQREILASALERVAAERRSAMGGARPAITEGSQPAGTVQMPPGVRPASVDQAFAGMGLAQAPTPFPGRPNSPAWDPFGTSSLAKDEARLASNDGGEAGFMSAFYPEADNLAVGAIDQATGGLPLPRQRPIPPATIPLTAVAQPQLGPITFRRGDTVEALARGRGMTTNEFAAHYGIADPNRIFAGQTVNPGGGRAPAPQQRTAPSPHQQTPARSAPAAQPGPTAINSKGKTVTQQTGTFYNPDTNKFEQRTVYR